MHDTAQALSIHTIKGDNLFPRVLAVALVDMVREEKPPSLLSLDDGEGRR